MEFPIKQIAIQSIEATLTSATDHYSFHNYPIGAQLPSLSLSAIHRINDWRAYGMIGGVALPLLIAAVCFFFDNCQVWSIVGHADRGAIGVGGLTACLDTLSRSVRA